MIIDAVMDSFIDSIRLLPFLFLTYLAMEYLEHKAGQKMQETIRSAGAGGPAIGSVLGIFPQCGFSTVASNLYAGRIITLGTLLAVFLSTSDEMLPIMISENVGAAMILKILAVKVIAALTAGFAVDILSGNRRRQMQIEHLCEQHHCHCENGIWKSALHHTIEIFLYIMVISFTLNLLIGWIGEDAIGSLFLNRPVVGELVAALVGMIPNCASSVAITQLYLSGVLSAGAMISGLLAGSGVGLLVLFRVNDDQKENIKILGLLYGIGVAGGIVVNWLGIVF
ncbi:MAG: arsenic efflux protein [Lachnospiraceae bacterium]|nr:arsenic efflux protein [Lachnospiraceae bacterium]